MDTIQLSQSLNKDLSLELPEKLSYEELHTRLSAHINDLIKNDFEKLVAYLYRIDVHEQKLRQLLQQHPEENAGNIIADLVIERQLQKIKTRQQFSQRDNDIEGEEKW